MKNITFNEQINQFLKNKAKENLRNANIRISLCTYSDFQKLYVGAWALELEMAHVTKAQHRDGPMWPRPVIVGLACIDKVRH